MCQLELTIPSAILEAYEIRSIQHKSTELSKRRSLRVPPGAYSVEE